MGFKDIQLVMSLAGPGELVDTVVHPLPFLSTDNYIPLPPPVFKFHNTKHNLLMTVQTNTVHMLYCVM